MKPTINIYDIIADKISALLNSSLKNTDQKTTWLNTKNGIALNPFSKTVYDGFNQLLLSFYVMEGSYQVNKWLTFKQASELGGIIRKGQKGNQIVYYNFILNYKGEKITNSQYDDLAHEDKKKVSKASFLNYYTVFNVAQIDGLPEEYYTIDDIQNTFLPIESLENLTTGYLENSGVSLKIIGQNRAFYSPSLDAITMPLKNQFECPEGYYSVLIHECIHSTGHKDRLNRKELENYTELDSAKQKYALEELVAELGSAFVLSKYGIETCISDNAEYIQSWLQALKNDKKYFITACGMAQKASNYLIETSNALCIAA